MGVGAIKADFGEGAPLTGQYASGRTGWYEHNLYPLRYNKAVADITKEVTGETSSGRAARGPAASVIRCTGAATPRIPIQRWPANCAADCHLGCRASLTGAMTSAALCRKRRAIFIVAGLAGEC